MREIIAHWQIRHRNIVELIGIHQFDKLPFPSMILQRAAHPSAIEYLRSHPAPQSFVKIVCMRFASPDYVLIVVDAGSGFG